jgi:N-acetylglucosamine-6-phosphate deacetylase
VDNFWLTRGRLVMPQGIVDGAVHIAGSRIAAVRGAAPAGARTVSVGGAYLAPGFIDLHVWGDPLLVAAESVARGTAGFLTTLGPEAAPALERRVARRSAAAAELSDVCVGLHLEGPFVNPERGGALPRQMRAPTVRELQRLWRASRRRLRLVTLAPELPGALNAIRWCRARGVVVSLGHSDADAATARRAVDAGARAVTHVFNGMRPFHHRQPGLVDVALTDPRLTAMVIFDGVHVSAEAFRMLYRAKGAAGVALVTDSIRHQGWDVRPRAGAYYTRQGVLAGSHLTMLRAVRNAVLLGGAPVHDAVRMASEVPARVLGLQRSRGRLAAGSRADLVAFDGAFRVVRAVVGGKVVDQ